MSLKFDTLKIKKVAKGIEIEGQSFRIKYREEGFKKFSVLCRNSANNNTYLETEDPKKLEEIFSWICGENIFYEMIEKKLNETKSPENKTTTNTLPQNQVKSPENKTTNSPKQNQVPKNFYIQKMSPDELLGSIFYWKSGNSINLIDNGYFREVYRNKNLFRKFNTGVRYDQYIKAMSIKSIDYDLVSKIFSAVYEKEITKELLEKYLKLERNKTWIKDQLFNNEDSSNVEPSQTTKNIQKNSAPSSNETKGEVSTSHSDSALHLNYNEYLNLLEYLGFSEKAIPGGSILSKLKF